MKPRPSDCDRAVELGLIRTNTQLVHLIVESLVNILDGSAKKCVDVYRGLITKELEDDLDFVGEPAIIERVRDLLTRVKGAQ